jgi:predicted phosphodiesterase
MRRFFQFLLTTPVLWLVKRFDSNPVMDRVHIALTDLYQRIVRLDEKKGIIIPTTMATARFIIFSDQHKGAKNGSDDFRNAEPTYISALNYYYEKSYHLIALGDNEELWENLIWSVLAKNKATTDIEKKFVQQRRFTKVVGNHDLFWKNDPLSSVYLKSMYDESIHVHDGVVIQFMEQKDIAHLFLTHGHQGDGYSDGNAFTAWIVARVWAPLQSYLNINPNTPSESKELKTLHNRFMYEWSKLEKNPVLITGHTHQPVFASLTHLERLYKSLIEARRINDTDAVLQLQKEIQFRQEEYEFVNTNYEQMKPFYFNTGCCCYSDGDITGIEITDGLIQLIKWRTRDGNTERMILESTALEDLLQEN